MTELRRKSSLWRGLWRAILVVVACAMVAGAALAFLMYPVWRSFPDVDLSPAPSQAEKNQQDLSYLRNLTQVDRSFAKERRREFTRSLDQLIPLAGTFDRAKLTIEAARLVALADNGHTNIVTLLGDQSFKSVPIRLGVFADGLFVVKATDEARDFLGTRLVSVNGRPTDELIGAFRPFIGGPDTLVRAHAPRLIVSPELLHATGLSDAPDRSVFRLLRADGSMVDRMLTASIPAKPEETTYWPVRDLSPVAPNKDTGGWSHVLDAAPLYLSRIDQNYWQADTEDGSLLYLQINRMRDQGSQPLADYLNQVLDDIAKRSTKYVVVDLRFNRGGNYLLAADFARALPQALPADGGVFILTSGNTFSAAISVASRLKYFAGPMGIQIGDDMGDRGQMWGEGDTAILPHSKIAVRYATAYHDWENGCGLTQITTCFLPNYIYGAAPGTLTPQVKVIPSFADYAAKRDPVMDEVMKLVGSATP